MSEIKPYRHTPTHPPVQIIVIKDEPHLSDIATAILRSRVAAGRAANFPDHDFLRKMAIIDARSVWEFLEMRGWVAPEYHAEPALNATASKGGGE